MSFVLSPPRLSFVAPMLPQLVAAPPADAGWLHEIKHDGYRTLLVIEDGRVRAFIMREWLTTNVYLRWALAKGRREVSGTWESSDAFRLILNLRASASAQSRRLLYL